MSALRLPPPSVPVAFAHIVRLADAHVADGGRPVELAGDEALRHPAFFDVIEYLLRRGLSVIVPTDGSVPEESAARLEGLASDALRFVVDAGAVAEPERRLAFLRRLQDHCELHLGQGWTTDDVVRLVAASGLEKTRIYVGPTPPPTELAGLARDLHPRRIVLVLGPDAGLERFSDAELGTLYRCGALLPR